MIVGCVEFDSGANKSVAFPKPLEYVVLAKISLNRIEVNRKESKIWQVSENVETATYW